mgnify:CR=1 FL=1
MKHFIKFENLALAEKLINQAKEYKKNPLINKELGSGKILGLLFFNPSLRTRLSTYKAAKNLGIDVVILSAGNDSWQIETESGTIMNGAKAEHIKDAINMFNNYCDLIGIRCFPELKNQIKDYREEIINNFLKYSKIPVINLESSTLHPLQSLADMITINEEKKSTPKLGLCWAEHIKALPQSVANSFAQWSLGLNYELHIFQPQGFELSEEFTKGAIIHNNLNELNKMDFIYFKNWSSYKEYGKIGPNDNKWQVKLKDIGSAKIMHCLPVRRNLEVFDELLDSENSLINQQAENRIYATQSVLSYLLENGKN